MKLTQEQMKENALDAKHSIQCASEHINVAYWASSECDREYHYNMGLEKLNQALSALGLKAVEVEASDVN